MTEKPTLRARGLMPWGVGLAAVAMVGLGVVVLPGLRLEPAPVSVAEAPSASINRPTPAPDVAEPDGAEPSFDLVRMESDGTTLVAGKAQPRSEVSVVVDGVTRAQADTDATGQFVVFVVLEISAQPRVMWLVSRGDGGETLSSVDTVILAPDGIAQSGPTVGGPAFVEGRPGSDLPPGTGIAARLAQPPAPTPGALPEGSVISGAELVTPADPAGTTALVERAEGAVTVNPQVSTATGEELPDDRSARIATVSPPKAASAPSSAPRALLSDRDGVRVLQTPPLDGTARVRLDSIDYGTDGAVVLRGRAEPGGTVAALLDGVLRGESKTDARGVWAIWLDDVAPGTYGLRVVRRDAAGTVTDRIDLPFRREAPGVVAAALSGAPARVVTVQQGATLWAIARDRYGDGTRYVQVYDANRTQIQNPDLIYPGQVISLPGPTRP